MGSRGWRLVIGLGLILCSTPGSAQGDGAQRDAGVEAVLGAVLGPSPLEEQLRFLCDRIGGRPTGSAALERAVDWSVERFREAGVDRVVAESFEMPLRWEEGATELRVIAPEEFPVPAVSIAWSPATAGEGVEGRVIDLGRAADVDLGNVQEDVAGAILLVHQDEMLTLDALIGEYLTNPPILHQARERGASAVLIGSTRPRGLLYRHQLTFDGLAPLPSALVSREAAQRIARLIRRGDEVRMKVSIPNVVGDPYSARNVVADVRGRERPEEMVILGAHLDSWGLGTGALDNGANSVMLIDVARALVASGHRPRRTVRFVLFSGEEQGLVGSAAYVRDHRDELDRVSAVVVYDLGVGRIRGYFLGGRPELEEPLRQALAPIATWGVDRHEPAAFAGTDHFDFLLEGVPNLVADQDPRPYLPDYHAGSDTLDKVDWRELRVQAAVAAVTAYGIAELQEPLGPRLDAAGVAGLLKDWNLQREMELFGIWDDYVAGRRGRKPPGG